MNMNFGENGYSHSVSNVTKGAYISNHVHSEFEIMLFVSGDADYVVENQRFSLSPYSLILTRPTEYHFLYFKNTSVKYERFWVHFNLDVFPKEIKTKRSNTFSVKRYRYFKNAFYLF